MPTRYVLRVQVDPADRADDVAAALLELAKDAGAEELCLFYAHHEFCDGHQTLDELRSWLDWSRPWRKTLADNGITVSLNPPHVFGHGDWERSRKPGQDWQPMVDPNGLTAEMQVCPLDSGWQAYFSDVLRLCAAEEFDVIWIEDDVRLHNHEPLFWGGCFCDLHLAEFARRTGISVTRQELVAACTAPGEPHPWRSLWFDAWQDSPLEIVESWRPRVAAGGARLVLMSARVR